jgi:hypothetical protein
VRYLAVVAVSLACACGSQPRLREDAYVWQRAWTPSVVSAVRERGRSFDELRVLALEIGPDGSLATAGSPLVAAGQRVVPVIRVDGTKIVDVVSLADEARGVVARFKSAGVEVRALEIDHDCASSQLASYAAVIRALKSAVDVPVQITALPSWAPSPALDDVIAAADAVTLQVHAVNRAEGLFSSKRARAAIDAFAKRMPANKPMFVALPAYGAANLWANPVDVAALLRSLEHDRPSSVAGVVWFRLPVDEASDGAWSFASLEAVRSNRVQVAFTTERDGADVFVKNSGSVDAIAPANVELAGAVGDGARGYVWSKTGFSSTSPPVVKAGERVAIGWMHDR